MASFATNALAIWVSKKIDVRIFLEGASYVGEHDPTPDTASKTLKNPPGRVPGL
ncbi:hypothetical protein D3C87_2110090 [compost metagenome]